MRSAHQTDREVQIRHLQETLLGRVARGREWATPGVEAALRQALAGIETGLEAASPRLQASLRTLADELAGKVEAAAPRLHQRIPRLIPEGELRPQTTPTGKQSRTIWWLTAAIVAIAGGVVLWRAVRPVPEPKVAPEGETAGDQPPDVQPVV
ncbi:hypothetical protein DBZ45_01585 [Arthrobacter globiformis]|uniref:Uncharacterized protein n=1 Tax=Arthrobacter globiformis TaxID=1665 RepID=A0A328HPV9_ARTGO|nr:hypothetical protein DBZ45_01585 [Arthrobacter globiformis]